VGGPINLHCPRPNEVSQWYTQQPALGATLLPMLPQQRRKHGDDRQGNKRFRLLVILKSVKIYHKKIIRRRRKFITCA